MVIFKCFKIILIFLFSFSILANSYSQESEKFPRNFTVKYSREVTYRVLSDKNNKYGELIKNRNENERAIENGNFGFDFSKSISNRYFLNYGFFISVKEFYQYNNDNTQIVNGILTFNKNYYQNNYVYNEIPLMLGIKTQNKIFNFYFQIGISNYFLFYKRRYLAYFLDDKLVSKKGINSDYKTNRFFLGSGINSGVQINILPKVSIGLEPYFRYGLTSIQSGPIKSKLLLYGLSFSLKYSFVTSKNSFWKRLKWLAS